MRALLTPFSSKNIFFIAINTSNTGSQVIKSQTQNKSKDYRVQKTYLIAITGEKIFPKVKHAPVRLALCDLDADKTSVLNDKILHIFIELPKFAYKLEDLKQDSSFLSKFAVAMKTMASYDERPSVMDDDMLVRMFDAADLHTYKSNDKHNYKKAVMNEFEYEETLKEYRQEGLEEGREEGLKEGREEGLKEGLKKGLKKGQEEEREASSRRIAAKMLQQGISLETISICTGLDKAEIASL